MSKIDDLIKEKCPNGVKYRKVWELTTWDKRYSTVDRKMQPKIIKYNYLLANKLKEISREEGNVFILETGINPIKKYTTEELAGDNICEGEIVAIPWGGTPNVKYYKGKFVTGDNRIATSNNTNILSNKFLYYIFENKMSEIREFYRGSGIKHPEMKKILQLNIPIPPIQVQEEIVKTLDKLAKLEIELEVELQTELKERKLQYEYWLKKLLCRKENNIKLKNIGKISMCKRVMKNQTSSNGEIPFYKIGTFGSKADAFISKELWEEYRNKYSYPKKGDILISAAGTIGKAVAFDGNPAYFQDSNIVWIDNDESKVLNKYLYYCYQTSPWAISTGGTIARIYNENIEEANIYLPTLHEQEKIIEFLEKLEQLIKNISKELYIEIEQRKKQYAYYRNELLNFKEVIA